MAWYNKGGSLENLGAHKWEVQACKHAPDKDPGKEIRISLLQQVIQKQKQYVHIRRI